MLKNPLESIVKFLGNVFTFLLICIAATTIVFPIWMGADALSKWLWPEPTVMTAPVVNQTGPTVPVNQFKDDSGKWIEYNSGKG